MAHKLFIDVQDSILNDHTLSVLDLTKYDPIMTVKDRLLQVLIPGDDIYTSLVFPQSDISIYTSVSLGISKAVEPIPDGLYIFHFSLAPSKVMNVSFNHFRTSILQQKLLNKMIGLPVSCHSEVDSHGNSVDKKTKDELINIWFLLKAAQVAGRNTLTLEKANSLYASAERSFERLFKTKSCL
jgi:hypothetical protein